MRLSPMISEANFFNSTSTTTTSTTSSSMSTKSFIILNHTKALSLSPDSGTDYGPFSASSSISPPFLSSNLKDSSYFPAERDVIGAEREIFTADREVCMVICKVLELMDGI